MSHRLALVCWFCLLTPLMADDVMEQAIKSWKGDVLTIGRDDRGEPLRVLISPGAWEYAEEKERKLYLIDVGSDAAALRTSIKLIQMRNKEALRPNANQIDVIIPVSLKMLAYGEPRERLLTFPPKGDAYNTPGELTTATIWRFAAWFGPDTVIDVHSDSLAEFRDFAETFDLAKDNKPEWQPGAIAVEARRNLVGMGTPLVARFPVTQFLNSKFDGPLIAWSGVADHYGPDDQGQMGEKPSQPRVEIQRRIDRSPEQVVNELLSVYGDQLNSVMYQPALAVLSRQRWAISQKNDEQLQQVQRILNPYLQGEKEALKGLGNGSQYAGHLAFAEWARHSGDAAAIKLVQAAADRGFDENGQPLDAMPTHNEMSDAVFMGCPILTAAAELTGEQKYLDMAGQHFRFMRKLCQREDGLYRHSPLCEAPWGRGNGFPALGLALSLTDLDSILANADRAALHPVARELRTEFRDALQQHLSALLEHQDVTGMWRQVIDDPRAYREMTSTCMIGFALQRSLDRGWLTEEKYQTAVDRAWQAVKVRTGAHGELMDVCTGTGKQKTLDDYLNRTAIWGKDERGGAMALMFATERALGNEK